MPTSFDKARLRYVTLQKAELSDALFDGCDLAGADLTGASLSGARWRNAQLSAAVGLDFSCGQAA